MISIVDYGMGNIGSISNMFKKIGATSRVVSTPEELEKAEKILLPGVGAFDKAMNALKSTGMKNTLDELVRNKIPLLGICLGMQLLTNGSEEGEEDGLGYIDAETLKFRHEEISNLKVPHMGWNRVIPCKSSKLIEDIDRISEDEGARFYFVHSYYVKVTNPESCILKTNYGLEFDAAIERDNVYGAQFHPEKSHKFGMALFRNFANL